ncbi:bifunctional DNA primase/polymerase [Agrococcus pavilionensis]|uniref:bifunctional DNA primase/polymerase n=1 Tax=Agrococcus pavilionensis TaxID=1346502 RepID=UPI0038992590
MPLSDAARSFAQAGVPVFPCRRLGKEPRTEHGFHDASAELRQVAAWWRRWPTANIGVPTGAVSGFEVVDVDVHPAGTGYAAFGRAQREGLVDGWAALVRTPSGRLHAYYPASPDDPHRRRCRTRTLLRRASRHVRPSAGSRGECGQPCVRTRRPPSRRVVGPSADPRGCSSRTHRP